MEEEEGGGFVGKAEEGTRCCFETGRGGPRVVGPRGVASGPSGFGIGTDAYLVRRRINIAAVTGASLGYSPRASQI